MSRLTKADKKAQAIAERYGRKDAEQDAVNEVPLLSDFLPFFEVEGLTLKQRKVLAVVFFPHACEMTIKVKSELAGVTTRCWYNTMRLPKFQDAMAQKGRELLGARTPEMLEKYIRAGLDGDTAIQRDLLRQCRILDYEDRKQDQGKDSSGGDTVVTIYNDFSELARVLENAAAGAKASAASDRGPFSAL